MSEKKLITREFLHSCKVPLNDGSAVTISEYLHFDDGSKVPNVRYLDNLPRPVYITKPAYRNHPEKKEFESVSKLDKYMVPDKDLNKTIVKILENRRSLPQRGDPNIIKTSPYVYLADQDVQVFIKHGYRKRMEDLKINPSAPTTGFFDTERTIDTGEFSVMSVTHENKIFTGIYNKFCKLKDGSSITLEYITDLYNKFVVPAIEKEIKAHPKIYRPDRFPIIPEFKFFDSELEMLQWVIGKTHEHKTAFVGIWNIDFDIPNTLKFLSKEGVDPSSIFIHPDVPEKYRKVWYQFDEQTANNIKKHPHPTDFWHWFHTPGFTQYLDSMSLYARNRKASTKEVSYSLDSILKKHGFGGKLKFDHLSYLDNVSKEDWHRIMTRDHFPEYILYNMVDVLALQLLEWLNNDIGNMITLSENTPISKFSKETRKLVTDYATRWIDRGYALGCSKREMVNSWDRYYPAIGGAVLSPNRIVNIGLRPFKDYYANETRMHAYVNDVDFSSIYPSVARSFNISKDTKLFTVVGVKGSWVKYSGAQAVEVFFAGVRNQEEECVRLATDFYNLPGFEEMEKLMAESLGVDLPENALAA